MKFLHSIKHAFSPHFRDLLTVSLLYINAHFLTCLHQEHCSSLHTNSSDLHGDDTGLILSSRAKTNFTDNLGIFLGMDSFPGRYVRYTNAGDH